MIVKPGSTPWEMHPEINGGLWTHSRKECAGPCPIHSPSDHVMKDFPLHYRMDRGLMERTCPHGVGHPDPDDLAFKQSIQGADYKRYAWDVHGCDGCCHGLV